VPSGFPCPIGGITRFGNEIDERDLAKTLLIDKPYYGYDGGVTFSGGEPLLQGEGVSGTAKLLAEKNVSCSIETSLFAPTRALELVAQHMQCMYIDVKILDKELCTSILGGSIDLFLSNVDFIFSKKIKTIFRFPVAHGYTDTEQNLKALETLLCSYTPTKVEYFPVHNLAAPKYRLLGQQANVFSESSLELTAVQDLCLRAKVDCEMLRA
jgi:Pyruvate-formate lyase-activating enzyme